MKTFFGILLIGLLGFLGCSGSNDGTSTTVGEATPVEPFGIEDTMTPTFEWTPIQWATRYRLLVQEAIQDSTTEDATENYIIDEWYTAEEAGCESEEKLCTVTPEIEFDGNFIWMVLACAGDECGLWSDELQFSYPPPSTPRFTDNYDYTVTDNHTNLKWVKAPGPKLGLASAKDLCKKISDIYQSEWRLPSLTQLKSLVDKSQKNPALPKPNPFDDVKSAKGDGYWTRDITWQPRYRLDYQWVVTFHDNGSSWPLPQTGVHYTWCVSARR